MPRSQQTKLADYQADRIEATLAQHKTPGRVQGGSITPRWISFHVAPAMGVRIADIKRLDEEVARALDVSTCRIQRRGATVVIEVPRTDAEDISLSRLVVQLNDVPPATPALGLADDGAPLLIRLPSPDVAHILIAGTTGSGKTELMRTMIASLLWLDRDSLKVLIDPRGGAALGCFAGMRGMLGPIVTEAHEGAQVLKRLVALMTSRDTSGDTEQKIIVFIDELADLLMVAGEEAGHALTRLLQRGRGAGIHIVAATQKPTAEVIGTLIKANFPVRLVGKVASANDASVASGWPGTGAERLKGRGDFIAVAEGQLQRFTAAYIPEDEIRQLVQRNYGTPTALPPLADTPPTEQNVKSVDDLVTDLLAAGWQLDWSIRQSCRELGMVEGGAPFYNVRKAVEQLREGSRATATGQKNHFPAVVVIERDSCSVAGGE